MRIFNLQSLLSKINHDANVVEVNRFLLSKRGYAIVAVEEYYFDLYPLSTVE